jgi:hypothetical protein
MPWEIVNVKELQRIKSTDKFKKKYKVVNKDTSQERTAIHWEDGPVVIYDTHFEDQVSRHNWIYNKQIGYVYAHFQQNDNTGASKSVYMHQFIMNISGNTQNRGQSVDHINQIKTHNTVTNLRYATQGEQNANRQARCDKQVPPQELQDIGITFLPRYIRYDKGEEKFVIERIHPGFALADTKLTSSGTKCSKVSMIYKYYDVLKKISVLNELVETEDINRFKAEQSVLFDEYCQIYKLITGLTYEGALSYNNDCSYTFLEQYLTEEDKLYERRGIPSDFQVDVDDLPAYCCYLKATAKRGDSFYISRHHPHLKEIKQNDVTTTASTKIPTKEKYDTMLALLSKIDLHTGEELKSQLSK